MGWATLPSRQGGVVLRQRTERGILDPCLPQSAPLMVTLRESIWMLEVVP